MAARQYDLVLFGATGYTGRLTAEHITTRLPTDLKWAVAGRSMKKLQAIVEDCKALNPDRIPPAIEISGLNGSDLSSLAQKTRLMIATVGPYSLYGEPCFKACAANGTHYLDVTGEVPFVANMIRKYENTAKASGSIMIPQIGLESAPADLMTFALVSYIHEKYGLKTKDVTLSLHQLNATPSGGTSSTILTMMDVFSLKELAYAHIPYQLSPIPGPPPEASTPLPTITKLLGIITIPGLGLMTSSVSAVPDRPIVHRSWGLYGGSSFYGPRFTFHEFMKTRNYFTGIVVHLGLSLLGILMTISVLRWIARWFIYAPGEGPDKEQARRERIEYRAIGIADEGEPALNEIEVGKGKKRVFAKAQYQGGMYSFTATFLANAAMCILYDDKSDSLAQRLGGGILTPACLGQKFIDRLGDDGFKVELVELQD